MGDKIEVSPEAFFGHWEKDTESRVELRFGMKDLKRDIHKLTKAVNKVEKNYGVFSDKIDHLKYELGGIVILLTLMFSTLIAIAIKI